MKSSLNSTFILIPPTNKSRGIFPTKLISSFVLLSLSLIYLSGCAYRFTNKHIEPPEGIKTIAVEAIYDTGREVLPHELLWGKLQDAIIKNGNLRLVDRGSADALLRVHIREAATISTGETKIPRGEPEKDPEVFGANTPPKTNTMRKLTRTGRYKETARTTFTAHAEVHNLRTRHILLEKTYSVATGTFWATQDTSKIKKRTWFLRYIEAGDAAFENRSESLANLIVQDLLVK